ncbi:hypothetical protein [Corynebacterium parakroppenstedtii]|uniref:hypothetical protein n=1 Tax=Corynebacterium parakroppenstedtii TaxID=2828363 RepID=UPI001C8D831F|nr:hypothetical protein [Corynebacterium parakroppenstedtii]MBY0789615.1 hypothetical protein [Corynebacterium parakroppenstedtii]MBY0797334.1 hypothetical protein [Corynebacterium parakroppenstedtii]
MKEQEPPPQNTNRQDPTIDWVENRYGVFPGDLERYRRPVRNNARATSRKNQLPDEVREGSRQPGNGQRSDRGVDERNARALSSTPSNTSSHFGLQWLFVALAVFLVVVFACVGFFLLRGSETTPSTPSDQPTVTNETVPPSAPEGTTSPENPEGSATGPRTTNPQPEQNDEDGKDSDVEKTGKGSEGKIVESKPPASREAD